MLILSTFMSQSYHGPSDRGRNQVIRDLEESSVQLSVGTRWQCLCLRTPQQIFQLVDVAVFDHGTNLHRIVNVVERVPVDDDDIGQLSGLDGAEIVLDTDGFGSVDRRGLKRFERREPRVHEMMELRMKAYRIGQDR